MPSFRLTIWEDPIPGDAYAIGGDPSEGLAHGDDSCGQVIHCPTGNQVAELQGKIEPFSFADQLFTLGHYYNEALIGVENNKDGGANKVLFELGYKNLYFEMKETGLPYQKPTAKLGYNVNSRTRAMLVAQTRKFLSDGSTSVVSLHLISQFETFALESDKFQAIENAHDDLVMSYLIACEMMRVQLMRTETSQNRLNPMWNGDEVSEPGVEDFEVVENQTRSQKLIDKHTKGSYEQDIVDASTVGNLAGF